MTSAFPPPVFIVAFTTLTLTVCTLLEIADAGLLVKCALTKPIEDGTGAVDSDVTLMQNYVPCQAKDNLPQ